MKPKGKVICVSGIDTGIGKTVITGLMARYLGLAGSRVITHKIVQTGCVEMSEDIVIHRRLMGCGILEVDTQGLTCPYVFSTPCSPHLAARLDGRKIHGGEIERTIEVLRSAYDIVLVEGAGGLLVPLDEDCTLLDFVADRGYPMILVTSPRLGSINHTLAALEVLHRRRVHLRGLVYNRCQETDRRIGDDSAELFRRYLRKFGFPVCLVDVPRLSGAAMETELIDFSCLFR